MSPGLINDQIFSNHHYIQDGRGRGGGEEPNSTCECHRIVSKSKKKRGGARIVFFPIFCYDDRKLLLEFIKRFEFTGKFT